jgi:hypothetical protein
MKAHFIMSVQRHCRNKISHVPKLAKAQVWDEKDEAVRAIERIRAFEKYWDCRGLVEYFDRRCF